METVIQVCEPVAAVLHGRTSVPADAEAAQAKDRLDRLLASSNLVLAPIHPGAGDRELMRYFRLEARPGAKSPDWDGALRDLEADAAITAAYRKPSAGPA